MTDLRKLIEAVEAGTSFSWVEADVFPNNPNLPLHVQGAFFSSSLDAAKALHEALLPGWDWEKCGVVLEVNHGYQTHTAGNKCPARAWLLAILKAYEAQL